MRGRAASHVGLDGAVSCERCPVAVHLGIYARGRLWPGRSCLPAVVNRRALLGERPYGLAEVLRRHQARKFWPQGREGRRLTFLFVTVHGRDRRTYPERRRRGDLARTLARAPAAGRAG